MRPHIVFEREFAKIAQNYSAVAYWFQMDTLHGNKVRVGQAMKTLGYESADRSNVTFYKVIPLKAA